MYEILLHIILRITASHIYQDDVGITHAVDSGGDPVSQSLDIGGDVWVVATAEPWDNVCNEDCCVAIGTQYSGDDDFNIIHGIIYRKSLCQVSVHIVRAEMQQNDVWRLCSHHRIDPWIRTIPCNEVVCSVA